MSQIRVRRVDVGPSSGMIIVGDEMRDVVDLRDARVWADDLRGRREVVELRAAPFPGMFTGKDTTKIGW